MKPKKPPQKRRDLRKTCLICKKEFIVHLCEYNRRKCCSLQCHIKNVMPHGYWLGKKRSDLHKTNAVKTMFKKGMTPWNKGKRCTNMGNFGDKNGQWRGGVNPISKTLRKSANFKFWRNAVFERDNWTCQMCGERGKELHPDHIKSFAIYPELRFEISNGRTLCVECHKKTPNYGYKAILVEGGGALWPKRNAEI